MINIVKQNQFDKEFFMDLIGSSEYSFQQGIDAEGNPINRGFDKTRGRAFRIDVDGEDQTQQALEALRVTAKASNGIAAGSQLD